jgi:hypothetical protein
MLNPHILSVRGATYSKFLLSFFCVALLAFLSSCSADLSVLRESYLTEESIISTHYSIVFVIHGNGDYLYHDTNGNKYKADEVTLAKAKLIAQNNPNAEVFIFYQKPRRHFLLFFPLKDGEFYYYRNGHLIENESYWRDQEKSNFDSEIEFYHRFHADNQNKIANIFLYFGHEIPELGGTGYDESYPDRTFNVLNLAGGLKNLTRDSSRFDIIILSTCFGGTPYTIGTLGPYAEYIIASPENLHLSYFDLQLLERLDLNLPEGDVPAFTKKFTKHAFDRLTKDVQTTVSVALYEVDRVQEFIDSVYKIYDHTLTALRGHKRIPLTTIEHCDCADIPEYLIPTINDGVFILYRPANFGRLKYKQNHSGWECWKQINP